MGIATDRIPPAQDLRLTDCLLADTPDATLAIPIGALPGLLTADRLLMPDGETSIEQQYQWLCNDNLLDNADFRAPVNQKGQTSYSAGYGIDRWYVLGPLKVEIEKGQIKVSNAGTEVGFFNQNVEVKRYAVNSGNPITNSALIKTSGSVVLFCGYNVSAEEFVNLGNTPVPPTDDFILKDYTYTFPDVEESTISIMQAFCIRVDPGAVAYIKAAKAEIGSVQTLAHKERGKWVQNKTPDYAAELAKCQRYYLKTQLSRQLCFISNLEGACIAWIQVRLPVAMRINRPTIVNFTVNPWISHTGAIYDTKGTNIKSVSVNSDGSAEKDGNIGFVVFFEEDLQNYVNGSIGCIGYLNLELDANL